MQEKKEGNPSQELLDMLKYIRTVWKIVGMNIAKIHKIGRKEPDAVRQEE